MRARDSVECRLPTVLHCIFVRAVHHHLLQPEFSHEGIPMCLVVAHVLALTIRGSICFQNGATISGWSPHRTSRISSVRPLILEGGLRKRAGKAATTDDPSWGRPLTHAQAERATVAIHRAVISCRDIVLSYRAPTSCSDMHAVIRVPRYACSYMRTVMCAPRYACRDMRACML